MFLQILQAQFAVLNKKPDMSKISSDLYILLPKRKKKEKSPQTAAAMRYLTDLDREKQTLRHSLLFSELILPAWMWQTV